MIKKTILLAIAAGALAAFAAPTVASAQLLTEEGTALAKGVEVTATSTNLVTTTTTGALACELVTLHGKVASNKPTSSAINNVVVTTEGCHLLIPFTIAATITNATVGTITINPGSGEAAATFEADVPGAGLEGCHLEGGVKFEFESETDVLTVPVSPLTGSGPGECPQGAGAGEIHGEFTLETSNGTPVTVD